MIQIIFFCLLIMSLVAGSLAYFNPSHKQINPLVAAMNTTGYTNEESTNTKRIQQINMSTSQGLIQIRKQMDDLAVKQSNLMGVIQDQEQVLKNASLDAKGVLSEAQQQGLADKDLLQLQSLSSDIDNKQRLLVSNGEYLLALDNQLTQNRKMVSDQAALASMNNQSDLATLQERYDLLQNQAKSYFENVDRYNQEVNNQMNELGDHYDNFLNNVPFSSFVQQQQVKDRIERLMDKVHAQMQKAADIQQKNKDLMQASQDNLAASQDRLQASMQRTQDLIEEQRERQEENRLAAPQNNP